MPRSVRTDLAMEAFAAQTNALEGIRSYTTQNDDIVKTVIHVDTQEAAAKIQKDIGMYMTFMCTHLADADAEQQKKITMEVSQAVSLMLPAEHEILVIGLGNRFITADALGPKVIEKILVTRHLKDHIKDDICRQMRSVCAIAPGVLGITGIETAEIIKGVIEHVKPGAVIVIDALAAAACERIASTIQITDTGIQPGSGVGNHRKGITKETMGVPVIAIGVPMVVYASTIAANAFEAIADNTEIGATDNTRFDLINVVENSSFHDMIVTPKDVDEMVMHIASIIALALNMSLQSKLSDDELQCLMH